MPGKYILYLSTNHIWGGSEVLWSQSAGQLAKKGYITRAGVYYDYELVKQFISNNQDYIDLRQRIRYPSLFQRVARRMGLIGTTAADTLHERFRNHKPDLVIISQGNNMDSLSFMKDCVQFNIPFITITHLVTEGFWPALEDKTIDELRMLYRQSKRNYFVSTNTLRLHEKIMGEKLENGAIVYNPFIKNIPQEFSFPPVKDGIYKVALIGRYETFHKGYDLLIDVLKAEKWKSRPIRFSLFGKGPHAKLLSRLLQQHNITSFTLHDHIEDIAGIWKSHHILIMPSRIEGQSLTLIEAMRFNRAAIVTNVGGTAELIEEGVNGFLAAYPTVECIDAAMERAWEQREQWEQLGLNAGKSIVQKHPKDALTDFNNEVEEIVRHEASPGSA